jgi:splicing factor 3A subunit 1
MVLTGIIRPPPEIRAVADKTALFVSKNGRAVETRIRNSDQGKTPKFAFLNEASPFHAYYEDRIRHYCEGGEETAAGDDESSSNVKKDKRVDNHDQRSAIKSATELEEKKDSIPNKEDDFETSKSNASKIVKAATVSESWKQSAQDPVARALLRERNRIRDQVESITNKLDNDESVKEGTSDENTHVDQKKPKQTDEITYIQPPPNMHYVTIVAPSSLQPLQVDTIKLVAQLIALDDSKNFLPNLTIREWNNPTFAFLQPRHAHFAYFSALVDCYKYTLDNLLGKSTENKSVLPIQETLENCLTISAYRAEYDRYIAERKRRAESGTNGEEEVQIAAIDWHDFVVVETIDFDKDEIVEPPLPNLLRIQEDEMEQSEDDNDAGNEDDDDQETIRVVPNYTPRVVSSEQNKNPAQSFVIDPITGKAVPADQTSEHLRIQLMDPKWAEERRKFQEKQKESNLVTGEIISTNLSRVIGDVPLTVRKTFNVAYRFFPFSLLLRSPSFGPYL